MEQSLQALSKQERLDAWTTRIMECRNSGMSVRRWCQKNGLNEKTYYYWQRRLFHALSAQHECTGSFAELTPMARLSTDAAVTVRIAGAEVDIHSGADAETISMVLRLLKSC